MTRRLAKLPQLEQVCAAQARAEQPWFLQSPGLRRLTEIWIDERRRQLGLGAVRR